MLEYVCWLLLNPQCLCVALSPTVPRTVHLNVGQSPDFLPPGDSFAANLSDGKCKLLARACCVFLDAFFSYSLRGQLLSFLSVLFCFRERADRSHLALIVPLTWLQNTSACHSFWRLLLSCCLYKAGFIGMCVCNPYLNSRPNHSCL